jgi:hypothetical protein
MNNLFRDDKARWEEQIYQIQEEDKRLKGWVYRIGSTDSIATDFVKALIIIALIALLPLLAFAYDSYLIPFSSNDWKAAGKSYDEEMRRAPMVRRLSCQYKLVGLTRAEIVRLLGEPKETWPTWSLAYSMGREYLVFRLKDGRVSNYAVVRSS